MKISNLRLEDINTVAKKVFDILPKKENATVIHLTGEMGAGKTTFVSALTRQLGITETVNSPTFIIMNEYTINNSEKNQHQFLKLIHLDAYRFEDKKEGKVLHLDSYVKDKNIIMIEWPDLMHAPSPDVVINIYHNQNDTNIRDFLITTNI